MTTTTRRAHIDSWASEARPADTHGPDRSLLVQQGAGVRKWAYAFCARPWASSTGVTVVSATLAVTLSKANPVASPVTLQLHRIEASWNERQVAWKSRPNAGTTLDATAVVAASAPKGTVVTFVVTAALQAIADGAPYFGFRIIPDPATTAGPLWLASSEYGTLDAKPLLTVDWTSPPDAPTDLWPSGGLFVSTRKPIASWAFGDLRDPSAFQSAFEVELDADELFTPALDYDSGQIAAGVSQLDLSATAYAGLPTDGAARYWRSRVWDDSGEVSEWSDPVVTRYAPLGTVTITAPAAATTPDVRPLIGWTFTPPATPTGEPAVVQEAWRVLVERQDGARWTNT